MHDINTDCSALAVEKKESYKNEGQITAQKEENLLQTKTGRGIVIPGNSQVTVETLNCKRKRTLTDGGWVTETIARLNRWALPQWRTLISKSVPPLIWVSLNHRDLRVKNRQLFYQVLLLRWSKITSRQVLFSLMWVTKPAYLLFHSTCSQQWDQTF